jgi:lipopolysaccharide biosynthesis glycosyltransferase
LIINCEKWRKENVTEKLLKIMQELGSIFLYPTQDAYNIYFDNNNYLAVDENYNSHPFYEEQTDDYKPKCIHYTTAKPWFDCTCSKAEMFWKFARKTPYYELLLNRMNENNIKSLQPNEPGLKKLVIMIVKKVIRRIKRLFS